MVGREWSVARPGDLLARDWGELGAIYDAGSGRTHLLNALAIELIDMLTGAPRTEEDLLAHVQALLPDELPAEEARAMLTAQLHALEQLDLLQATPA